MRVAAPSKQWHALNRSIEVGVIKVIPLVGTLRGINSDIDIRVQYGINPRQGDGINEGSTSPLDPINVSCVDPLSDFDVDARVDPAQDPIPDSFEWQRGLIPRLSFFCEFELDIPICPRILLSICGNVKMSPDKNKNP